jgi:hypothetical protein
VVSALALGDEVSAVILAPFIRLALLALCLALAAGIVALHLVLGWGSVVSIVLAGIALAGAVSIEIERSPRRIGRK